MHPMNNQQMLTGVDQYQAKSDPILLSRCQGTIHDTVLESWSPDHNSLATTLSNPNIGEKDGTYFLRCAGTKRGNDSTADTANIIILDGDSRIDDGGEIISGAPDPELVHICLASLGVSHFIYSSHSNGATSEELANKKPKAIDSGGLYGADYHKYRVIIPCTYNREHLPAILDYLFKELHKAGVMLADVKENHTWAQAWYLPRIPDQPRYYLFKYSEHVGSTLDVESIFSDWLKTNPASIANPVYVTKTLDRVSKQDVRAISAEHGSSIAPFNETHDLIETLESFGYIKKGKDRWLYPNSTSGIAGVLLCRNCKDGRLRFYSTHGSDPLNDGKPKDAFDIYRILGCGSDMKTALNWNPALTKQLRRDHMQQQAKASPQATPINAKTSTRPVLLAQQDADIDYSTMPEYGETASPTEPPPPTFQRISIADVLSNPPEPQRYIWAGRIPAEECTLLAAHGGTGKSLFAVQLAIHTAIGIPFLGLPTERVKTLFFSAEDSTSTIRRRVGAICQSDGLDPVEVDRNLIALDATDATCLFHEVMVNGVRYGEVTSHYQELKAMVEAERIEFLIVDNASDVYGANPIDRQAVTKFIRALVRLVRGIGGAVLLLAHVNKVTSKNGKNQTDTESYADSAAWHNATRSRMFLVAADDTGGLSLHHQKNNFGRTQPELPLCFRENGSSLYVPDAEQFENQAVAASTKRKDARLSVLKLIYEFYQRGEFISPSPSSALKNAFAMLRHEQGFPFGQTRDDKAECFTLLRECERDGLLSREVYKNQSRHDCDRWGITERGVEFINWPSVLRDELQSG